jgi:hypothetical protein
MVTSSMFKILGNVAIVANTASLATEHYNVECIKPPNAAECFDQAVDMPQSLRDFLEVLNLIFVIYFAVEMVLLNLGLGKQYWSDAFNVFDAFVVIASILEIIVSSATGGLEGSVASALRTLRLARLFRLVKSWATLKHIVDSLMATIPNIASCCLLLLLYMFMSSIAGMQLLGERLPEDSRSRFDGFWISMLTIFSMLSGENWNEFMYEGISPPGHETNYWFAVFYVVIFIIGGFVVLNLFLAILLAEFDAGPDPDWSLGGFKSLCMEMLPCFGGAPEEAAQEADKEEEEADPEKGQVAVEMAAKKKTEKPQVGFGRSTPNKERPPKEKKPDATARRKPKRTERKRP